MGTPELSNDLGISKNKGQRFGPPAKFRQSIENGFNIF